VKNGALLATAFLSVTVNSQGKRGLLGVTLDPDFEVNQYVYVYYTATTPILHNDVGQDTWEEINEGRPGANHGWPATEGPTTDSRFTGPLYAYTHASAACAISGGAFYPVPAPRYPADFASDYFFADFCGGWIRRYDFASATATEFVSQIAAPVDLAVGLDGSLYYLARGNGDRTGVVVRVDFAGHEPPIITAHPSDVAVAVAQTATFQVTASGPSLSYQWQRNDVDIPGATSAVYSLSAGSGDKSAQFRCRVFNGSVDVISNPATLTVIVGRYPAVTIQTPSVNVRYRAGGVIAYSGWAADREDGVLPASRFTWEVVFHHNGLADPLVAPRTGDRRVGAGRSRFRQTATHRPTRGIAST
jgi:hypothetical protein